MSTGHRISCSPTHGLSSARSSSSRRPSTSMGLLICAVVVVCVPSFCFSTPNVALPAAAVGIITFSTASPLTSGPKRTTSWCSFGSTFSEENTPGVRVVIVLYKDRHASMLSFQRAAISRKSSSLRPKDDSSGSTTSRSFAVLSRSFSKQPASSKSSKVYLHNERRQPRQLR